MAAKNSVLTLTGKSIRLLPVFCFRTNCNTPGVLPALRPEQLRPFKFSTPLAACEKLGIEGLDLYGGTTHTTTTELGKIQGKKAAKKHSGHRTNKAFDRYCQIDEQESADIAKLIIKKKTNAELISISWPEKDINEAAPLPPHLFWCIFWSNLLNLLRYNGGGGGS